MLEFVPLIVIGLAVAALLLRRHRRQERRRRREERRHRLYLRTKRDSWIKSRFFGSGAKRLSYRPEEQD